MIHVRWTATGRTTKLSSTATVVIIDWPPAQSNAVCYLPLQVHLQFAEIIRRSWYYAQWSCLGCQSTPWKDWEGVWDSKMGCSGLVSCFSFLEFNFSLFLTAKDFIFRAWVARAITHSSDFKNPTTCCTSPGQCT